MPDSLLKKIQKYSSLVKISHSVFSMPFAIIGYYLGLQYDSADFNYLKFIFIILCVFFARNAAMSFNRLTDRNIDKKNPRTITREIPAGIITSRNAAIFLSINILLFLASAYMLNMICFLLSPVALLVILGYSYTKRFTGLCHFILGSGLALAPIGAFLAITGKFHLIPLLYSFVVLFWVAGFDIIYALHDIEFDQKQKLRSIPARFGIKKSLIISLVTHLLSLAILFIAGWLNHSGIFFWIGFSGFALFIAYQHYIVKPHDLSRINLAFFTLNGFSGVFLLIFFLLDYYL